jgi:hypothetical protein
MAQVEDTRERGVSGASMTAARGLSRTGGKGGRSCAIVGVGVRVNVLEESRFSIPGLLDTVRCVVVKIESGVGGIAGPRPERFQPNERLLARDLGVGCGFRANVIGLLLDSS